MRTKFMKYGKRLNNGDGQSEYFEVSVEVMQGEDPADCAKAAKRFVWEQLAQAEVRPLTAKIGEIAGKMGPVS